MRKALLILLVLISWVGVAAAKANRAPGFVHDKSTTFQVEGSAWKNITITTSAKTELKAESLPNTLILKFSPVNSKPTINVSVSGLDANTQYFKYTDSYANLEELLSDGSGVVNFTLDNLASHLVFIQTKRSTRFINDDSTGGNCVSIGSWNNSTKTCTLNTDLTETLQINGSGITLDGAGHTITGSATGNGIYATGVTDVRIRNIKVTNFTTGVFLNNVVTTRVDGVIAFDNRRGITLSGGERNVIINNILTANSGIASAGINLDTSVTNVIQRNTISGSEDGARLYSAFLNELTSNTFQDNNVGVAVTFGGGYIFNNNFLGNTTQADVQFDSNETFFFDALPTGGNFWSDHPCADLNSDEICDNPYIIEDNFFTADVVDQLPWACQNGWLTSVDCTGGGGGGGGGGGETWAEISSTTGTATLYTSADTTSVKLKILPNAWVIKILDNSGSTFWKVEDVTDNTIGWMEEERLNNDSTKQAEFEEKAGIFLEDSTNERKEKILEAIKHYFFNMDTTNSLYSGKDHNTNFTNFINDGVVKEIILGIATAEISMANYDNEFVTPDFGHGIMQVTSQGLIGLGSNVTIPDCELPNSRVGCYTSTKDISILNSGTRTLRGREYLNKKYYANSHQAFFANIKDGMRAFQQKFASAKNKYDPTPNREYESLRTGEKVNTPNIKIIHAVRGYNSLGSGCFPLFNIENVDYLEDVKDGIRNAKDDYGIDPLEQSDLTTLLAYLDIAIREQQYISVCSPAYLQIFDSTGKMTGFDGMKVIDELPGVVYDTESFKHASILLDLSQYKFKIIATEDGTYSLPAGTNYFGQKIHFIAKDIPITTNENHIYTFNWSDLSTGKDGVTIEVDKTGDGIINNVFKSDIELTAEEFVSQTSNKITICHIPPGNIGNPQTINVGKPALKAHLAHGDTKGPCTTTRKR